MPAHLGTNHEIGATNLTLNPCAIGRDHLEGGRILEAADHHRRRLSDDSVVHGVESEMKLPCKRVPLGAVHGDGREVDAAYGGLVEA